MDAEIEAFNEQQSLKWMKLPRAETRYLVEELAKRDGVYFRKLGKGERFQYVGPGAILVVERSEDSRL